MDRIIMWLDSILHHFNRTQPKYYKAEVCYLHCPPEKRDACPIWKAGYDVPTFKDESPEHHEGCLNYRRYLGPTGFSPSNFTRIEWQEWLEKSEQKHYFCSNKDIIIAAVIDGKVEGAFIEDGKPYWQVKK